MRTGLHLLCLGATLAGLAGCRGAPSEEPPVHLNPNMDTQDKYKPYRASGFFKDGMAMRTPPAGTVPWARAADLGIKRADPSSPNYLLYDRAGALKASDHFYRGEQNGKSATQLPTCKGADQIDCVKVDAAFIKRGQGRYDIYCAPCHDYAGYGKGPVPLAGGMVPPPSYHDDYRRNLQVGDLFKAITNGVRTMPSYAHQIPEADRWAIVAYIRALQRSQHASEADVPEAKRGSL